MTSLSMDNKQINKWINENTNKMTIINKRKAMFELYITLLTMSSEAGGESVTSKSN